MLIEASAACHLDGRSSAQLARSHQQSVRERWSDQQQQQTEVWGI
jgi:hypothetical protein